MGHHHVDRGLAETTLKSKSGTYLHSGRAAAMRVAPSAPIEFELMFRLVIALAGAGRQPRRANRANNRRQGVSLSFQTRRCALMGPYVHRGRAAARYWAPRAPIRLVSRLRDVSAPTLSRENHAPTMAALPAPKCLLLRTASVMPFSSVVGSGLTYSLPVQS